MKTILSLWVLSSAFLTMSLGQSGVVSDLAQFNEEFKDLIDNHHRDGKVDYEAISNVTASALHLFVSDFDYESLTGKERSAYLINAYNFLVIKKVKEYYPISSVSVKPNFFKETQKIGPYNMSLAELEAMLLKEVNEPMIHMLLNCSALSCPPLQFVDDTENWEDYYRAALSSGEILSIEDDQLSLSKIFFWYTADFGSEKEMLDKINQYIEINKEAKVTYKDYDWSLNSSVNQGGQGIFYTTNLYSKGQAELKIFNNYYTQIENGVRANFFSSIAQVLVGTKKKINWGFDIKLRSVTQGQVSTFSALRFADQQLDSGESSNFARVGISGVGPRIKYQPFVDKPNINFVHAVYVVPMSEAEGNEQYGYSDYNNLQWFNQIFIEKDLSYNTRLFFDLGLHVENIKLGVHRNESHFTPIQMPLTAIYNYYPNPKLTLYALGSFAQRLDLQFARDTDTRGQYSIYGQLGTGIKYFVTDFLEIEALYTNFRDDTPGRVAHTFNLGLRILKK